MSEITDSEEQKVVQDPKKEILEELFGAVHEYADVDFSCAFESRASLLLHGRMYITDTFIGFYTNLFGIEKKIQIGLKAITSVKPLTTIMFIPNAITIETDERSFIFRSFLHRDKCISTIETYIAKFKAEEERQARKKEKILKNAVKQSAKTTKESLDKFAETSRESFSHIAVAGRSVRSSIFSGITSVFRGPAAEEEEPGADEKKGAKSTK